MSVMTKSKNDRKKGRCDQSFNYSKPTQEVMCVSLRTFDPKSQRLLNPSKTFLPRLAYALVSWWSMATQTKNAYICLFTSVMRIHGHTFCDTCNRLTELLTTDPDLRKMVFGVNTVSTYNVTSFFFKLVASKMLVFQKTKITRWSTYWQKNENGQHKYMDIKCWSGFEFRSGRSRGAVVSYHTLATQGAFRSCFRAA